MRLLVLLSLFPLLVIAASCASSGQPCCSIPLSLSIPCGGGGATPAAAPAPVAKTESPPPSGDDEAVRRRASFELECDAKALSVVVLDSHTRGVSGCNKRAVYVKDCSTGPCDWLPKPAEHPAQ